MVLRFGDRRWRIRGLRKNTSFDVLKVNLLVSRGEALHVHSFDLYSAKHRQAFARLAAAELELEDSVLQRELGKVLLKCEELQERQIEETLKPKLPAEVEMPEAEREAALSLLRDPSLVDGILTAFEAAGLVGEPVNALVGYLVAVSRKLTIASTGKDPQTGKLVTEEYRVEGPVMLLLTTTAIDIDEELLNRCLVLTVDESRDQTRRMKCWAAALMSCPQSQQWQRFWRIDPTSC